MTTIRIFRWLIRSTRLPTGNVRRAPTKEETEMIMPISVLPMPKACFSLPATAETVALSAPSSPSTEARSKIISNRADLFFYFFRCFVQRPGSLHLFSILRRRHQRISAGRSQVVWVSAQRWRVLHLMLRERVHSATLPSMHFVNRVVCGRHKPASATSCASAARGGKSAIRVRIRNALLIVLAVTWPAGAMVVSSRAA